MTFLSPILEKKNHTGNYPDEENTRSSEDQGTENNQNLSNTQDVEDSSVIERSTPKIKKKEKDVPTQILKLIKEKRNEQTVEHEDDDDKYLLSFRTELKAMTKTQKIDFKIGMLQLLRKITDPQHGRNTQPSCSSRQESHNYRTSSFRSPSSLSNFSSHSSSPITYDRRIMRTTGSVPLFLVNPAPQQEIPNQIGVSHLPSSSTMNATETVSLNVQSTSTPGPAIRLESSLYENDEEYVDDDMNMYLKFKNEDL